MSAGLGVVGVLGIDGNGGGDFRAQERDRTSERERGKWPRVSPWGLWGCPYPSRGGSGVGLGLAVARGFVRAMEGELLIEDTPDGGTTAVVSLGIAS